MYTSEGDFRVVGEIQIDFRESSSKTIKHQRKNDIDIVRLSFYIRGTSINSVIYSFFVLVSFLNIIQFKHKHILRVRPAYISALWRLICTVYYTAVNYGKYKCYKH